MHREDNPHLTGIDSKFRMEYMGRAEFEWGALPNSLKCMRASKPENSIIKQIKGDHIPDDAMFNLWYVGREQEFAMAEAVVYAEFDPHRPPHTFKERLYLSQRLDPEQTNRYSPVDGVWALNPDHRAPELTPFAIFIKKDYAKEWLKALT